MKNSFRPLLALTVFRVCTNLGEQKKRSVVGNDKPNVDIYGELIDREGNTYTTIHNIVIGRLYKGIPVYVVPKNPDTNPTENSVFIDLVEVKQIAVPNPDVLKTFKGIDYIEIVVTHRNDDTNSFIVERSRTILCDEKKGDDFVKKELKFGSIKTLSIEGFKRNDETIEEKDSKKKNTPALTA